MKHKSSTALSRRTFLAGVGASAGIKASAGVGAALTTGGAISSRFSTPAHAAPPVKSFKIKAGPGTAQLAPPSYPITKVWSFNGVVPGPELRVRQGERLRFEAHNGLGEDTTVHCHGIRLPNNMDGIPYLTQKPIEPGKSFTYEFDVPDAGTYWYHPHLRSSEQVGRGLYGALIIEEREPIKVDRDITWMIDDWRLDKEAQIAGGFGDRPDMVHGGRIGNIITVNGLYQRPLNVKRGERIRLRLINAANARIFSLDFGDLSPKIIAYDGQPVTPHEASNGLIFLAPAMRVDLIIDMMGKPGSKVVVQDNFFRDSTELLTTFVYDKTTLRDKPLQSAIQLPNNTMPEPDMGAITTHDIVFNGGMMGGGLMRGSGARNMMEQMRDGKVWFINGVAVSKHISDPVVTLQKGRSYLFDMRNDTVFDHPIHLHGHSFRVLSRNGILTKHQEWQDTVLMAPRERVQIAFVADNPGDWMFHCHIFEHQESGMMGVVRVQDGPVKA